MIEALTTVGAPRKANRTVEGTAFDRIKACYAGELREEQLHAHEVRIMERWENIWRLLKKHLKQSVAIKHYMKMCERNGDPISHITAYRDLQQATKLWGGVSRLDKQVKLLVLDEMAITTYKKAMNADELGEMNRAIANLIKINEQVEDYMSQAREAHTYELHVHLNGKKKTLDLNKLPVQNVEYQEVIDEMEKEKLGSNVMAQLIDEAKEEDGSDETEF